MEFILPCNIEDKDNFCNRAVEVGFTEFVAKKFIYTMQDSDLDVYPVMATERMSLLLYGWELCDGYVRRAGKTSAELPDNTLIVMKKLTNYSLHLWFSREWERCADKQKTALLFCMRRAAKTWQRAPQVPQLKWDFLLKFDKKPWDCEYFKQFFEGRPQDSIVHMHEDVEPPASDQDIYYVRKEDLLFVLLRLIKLFDGGYMNGARMLAMRVIVAWNHIFKEMAEVSGIDFPEITAVKKEILLLICHVHLMTIYEIDDKRGLVIDNMMSNIHFYTKNMQKKLTEGTLSIDYSDYTAAQYIALTCINLRLKSNDFIDAFAFNNYPKTFTTLFGAISQSYGSYLLGNALMEMNNMSKRDFEDNLDRYKIAISLYVNERERSEKFLQGELRKKDKQRTSHNKNITLKRMTDLESKIRKGNHTNCIEEETVTDLNETEEDHLQLDDEDSNGETKTRKIKICSDPIFENMPNKECLLTYTYDVIANRAFKGWRFAKIVLLIKIISHQLNAIETWRYHPGLTTEFMLNLEVRLARHFEDMAKIFHDHDFMEQEFWLTAFYLDPTTKYYKQLIECGTRFFRRRQLVGEARKSVVSAKFGLLSSTIDVNEILHMTNHANPNEDYDPLEEALRTLCLPKNVVKDLLTITFLPRNKSFSWAVKWAELRKRCKNLLNKPELKRRFVEMNMAEANDRLQFLHIDYDKYKHRPQINYGTIEEGYEGGLVGDLDDDEEEDDDYDDYDEYEDYAAAAKKEKEETKIEELDDSYFAGTRRTRARVAAVIATAMMKDESIRTRIKIQPKSAKGSYSSNSSSPSPSESEKPTTSVGVVEAKHNLDQLLNERPTFDNNTPGFKPFPDIWDFNNEDLNKLDKKSFSAFEMKSLVQDFSEMNHLLAPITPEPPREPVSQKSPSESTIKRSRSSVCTTPAKLSAISLTPESKKRKLDVVEATDNSRDAVSDMSSSEETKNKNMPKRLLRSTSHLHSDDEPKTKDDLNVKSSNETNVEKAMSPIKSEVKVPSPTPKLKKQKKRDRRSAVKEHAKPKSKKKALTSALRKNIKANEKQEAPQSPLKSPGTEAPKSIPLSPKSAAKSSSSVHSSEKFSPKSLRSSSMWLRISLTSPNSVTNAPSVTATSPKSEPMVDRSSQMSPNSVLMSQSGARTKGASISSKSAPVSPNSDVVPPKIAGISQNQTTVSSDTALVSPSEIKAIECSDKGTVFPNKPIESSVKVKVLRRKVTASQRKARVSPEKANVFSDQTAISLTKGTVSPSDGIMSPKEGTVSLDKPTMLPDKAIISPVKASMSPNKVAVSPSNAVVSTSKTKVYPINAAASPSNATVHSNATDCSDKAAVSTSKVTVLPIRVTRMSQNRTVKSTESSCKALESPNRDTVSPTESTVSTVCLKVTRSSNSSGMSTDTDNTAVVSSTALMNKITLSTSKARPSTKAAMSIPPSETTLLPTNVQDSSPKGIASLNESSVSIDRDTMSPNASSASPDKDTVSLNKSPNSLNKLENDIVCPNKTTSSSTKKPESLCKATVSSSKELVSSSKARKSAKRTSKSSTSAPASPKVEPASSKDTPTWPKSAPTSPKRTSMSPKHVEYTPHGVPKNTSSLQINPSLTPNSDPMVRDKESTNAPNYRNSPPTCSENAQKSTLKDPNEILTQQLVKECLERKCVVALTKLSNSDLVQLRQPKVIIKRINLETFLKKATVATRMTTRRGSRTSYVDIDENSSSNSGPSTRVRSKRTKRLVRDRVPTLRAQQHATVYSESSLDCEEYEQSQRNRRRATRSTGQTKSAKIVESDNNRRSLRTRQLIVTPRSASGLKLRISTLLSEGEGTSPNTAERSSGTRKFAPYNDIIQISSTDSMLESDPLYEEEVILP